MCYTSSALFWHVLIAISQCACYYLSVINFLYTLLTYRLTYTFSTLLRSGSCCTPGRPSPSPCCQQPAPSQVFYMIALSRPYLYARTSHRWLLDCTFALAPSQCAHLCLLAPEYLLLLTCVKYPLKNTLSSCIIYQVSL